jgi:Trypsin
MNCAIGSVAAVMAGAVAVLLGSGPSSAQATIDAENSYPNVGAIMVWRVDDSGKPVELRAFASGTLIRPHVLITAGHFTAPVKALGEIPPTTRIFASFSATDARNPDTWTPVIALATHPSMPHCPPPPQCDPTDDILVAPLEPGIADVGLVFLERAPANIKPAVLAAPGTLEKSEGARTTIVGYGVTSPAGAVGLPVDAWPWDGKRRIRSSAVRKIVDDTWGLWSIPSYVCFGDSGGGIFLEGRSSRAAGRLVANVSDGGRDCRRHNNNHRLDTRAIQKWIDDTVKANQND